MVLKLHLSQTCSIIGEQQSVNSTRTNQRFYFHSQRHVVEVPETFLSEQAKCRYNRPKRLRIIKLCKVAIMQCVSFLPFSPCVKAFWVLYMWDNERRHLTTVPELSSPFTNRTRMPVRLRACPRTDIVVAWLKGGRFYFLHHFLVSTIYPSPPRTTGSALSRPVLEPWETWGRIGIELPGPRVRSEWEWDLWNIFPVPLARAVRHRGTYPSSSTTPRNQTRFVDGEQVRVVKTQTGTNSMEAQKQARQKKNNLHANLPLKAEGRPTVKLRPIQLGIKLMTPTWVPGWHNAKI
jgi:hypothetical protein